MCMYTFMCCSVDSNVTIIWIVTGNDTDATVKAMSHDLVEELERFNVSPAITVTVVVPSLEIASTMAMKLHQALKTSTGQLGTKIMKN